MNEPKLLIGETETWPDLSGWTWGVLDDDERYGRRITQDGPSEVVLVGRPPDWPRGEEKRAIVVPLYFPSPELAQRAGEELAEAFRYATALAQTPLPDKDECAHVGVWQRFSRTTHRVRMCNLCNAVLEESNADGVLV